MIANVRRAGPAGAACGVVAGGEVRGAAVAGGALLPAGRGRGRVEQPALSGRVARRRGDVAGVAVPREFLHGHLRPVSFTARPSAGATALAFAAASSESCLGV